LIRPSNTWAEKYVCPWFREVVAWGIKSPLSLGRVLVVPEHRPAFGGENDCAQAAVKHFPVKEAVLPKAWDQLENVRRISSKSNPIL